MPGLWAEPGEIPKGAVPKLKQAGTQAAALQDSSERRLRRALARVASARGAARAGIPSPPSIVAKVERVLAAATAQLAA
eukprot:8478981-Alexandrium_andersonii.AAC.1